MTNAEARFSNSLRPRKPEGSLGRTAQDGHLDSHTAPELYVFEQHLSLDFIRWQPPLRFTDAFTPVSMIEPYVDGHGDVGKGEKKVACFPQAPVRQFHAVYNLVVTYTVRERAQNLSMTLVQI